MLFSGDLGNGYIKCRSSMCEAESYRSVISVVSTMLGNFKLDLSRKNHDLIIGFDRELLQWLTEHRGHRISLFDEYEVEYDQIDRR
jgi:hypothetical protein